MAFYCTSSDVTSCAVESYLTGRKTKAYLA